MLYEKIKISLKCLFLINRLNVYLAALRKEIRCLLLPYDQLMYREKLPSFSKRKRKENFFDTFNKKKRSSGKRLNFKIP